MTQEAVQLKPGELALYGRTSGEEQRERHTIGLQVEAGRHHCAARGLPEPVFYLDDGVSGTIPFHERAEGRRLLADAQGGKIKAVLVYRIDRLGRRLPVVYNLAETLQELGVSLSSVTETFDTATSLGRAFLALLAIFAEMERNAIVERTCAGSNRKAREGKWPGGRMIFGYRAEAGLLLLDKDRVPGSDLSPVDVIRLIFRLCVEERLSCQKIADRLNALGVPTARRSRPTRDKTDGLWKVSVVHHMLTNPIYHGLLRVTERAGKKSGKERELFESEVPPIVTLGDWTAAQRVLAENKLYSQRNAQRDYLLRGLIRCGACGGSYIASSNRPKHWVYVCAGRRLAHYYRGPDAVPCEAPSLLKSAEAGVWADVEGFIRNPGAVLAELAAQRGKQAEEVGTLQKEIARLTRELDGKAKERNAVISLLRRGVIDEGEMEAQRSEILREEEGTRAELAWTQARATGIAAAEADLSAAETLLRDLRRAADGPWTFAEKRHAVETLVERITMEKDEEGQWRARVRYRFGDPGVIATATPQHDGRNRVYVLERVKTHSVIGCASRQKARACVGGRSRVEAPTINEAA